MTTESIAADVAVEGSQALNPQIYARLGSHAAYEIETLALRLRDSAIAQHDELDIFVISSAIRLRDLAGALMALADGRGTPSEALTIWGGTIDAFTSTLSEEALYGTSAARCNHREVAA